MNKQDQLLEALAELEHKQWKSWAGSIINDECISPNRRKRWCELLSADYSNLGESEKEKDREWARKVLEIVGKF